LSPRPSLTFSLTSAEASSTRPLSAFAMLTPTVNATDLAPGLKSAAKLPLSGKALSVALRGVSSLKFLPISSFSLPR
jgi:hypothetical protein